MEDLQAIEQLIEMVTLPRGMGANAVPASHNLVERPHRQGEQPCPTLQLAICIYDVPGRGSSGGWSRSISAASHAPPSHSHAKREIAKNQQ